MLWPVWERLRRFGQEAAPKSRVLRVVLLLVAIAGSVLVFIAADHGGGLVFQYGIAVAPAEDRLETGELELVPKPPDRSAEEADIDVESRLLRLEDGSRMARASGNPRRKTVAHSVGC